MTIISINHVGIVVPSIERYLIANELLYVDFTHGQLITNNTQQVHELFLTDTNGVTLELLEPLNNRSPIHGLLKNNPMGTLAHICYNCDNITKTIAELLGVRGKLISGPTADIAFDGRPIAFLFLGGQLIELVQR